MKLRDGIYNAYVQILLEELVPAMGCTEPIAIAYCAAKARDVLGEAPDRIEIEVSGNILKNVKGVVVPNTGGLKGIAAAAGAGVIAGDAGRRLEVIAEVSAKQREKIKAYLRITPIFISCADSGLILDINMTVSRGSRRARVRIANNHTNIVYIEKDGHVLFQAPVTRSPEENLTDKSVLNVREIVEFANIAHIDDVEAALRRQISLNMAIAEEGIRGDYGANVGSVLLSDFGGDVKNRAKAMAAAGSDARMSGCELPVVILSGSGNQGITASVPVVIYARELKVDEEKLYRALIVSNLVTVHQKSGIGRLSAFCGAVSAGCGAGAGIAYLKGGDYEVIAHTIVNALAIVSGIVCDGAKPSCAAKIASAVEAGLLGYHMYLNNQQFRSGDGIVAKGVDNTIANVGCMARDGMRETDREILRIMTKE